jgi:signal transduction histidine kinase
MAPLTLMVLFIGVVIAIVITMGTEGSLGMALMLLLAIVYLVIKMEVDRRQLGELHRLKAAYGQLDQQAKLIIRTDLELHRTQEELDRRLASLMSLHRLGRQLQVSLRPEEVFGKLDASIVTSFGFSKGLLGMCASLTSLDWRSVVGVNPATADHVKTFLVKHELLKPILTSGTPQILDSASPMNPMHQQLLNLLGVTAAALAGVMPHAGPAGCLILGRMGGSVATSKADEELVAILTNQLVIAVENSALYEKTWAAQRELERKVQERTRELAEANAELLRLNKAKSDFVSAVSHELRTPLSAIKGYAALLSSGQFGPLAKAQSERIAKVEKHADLLTLLINNLLDIARIESGRVTMEQWTIPAQELFATVQEAVHPQLEAKHLRYAVDLDGVKEVVGDPQHLQRVFVNLLSNAVKYTPDSGSIRVGLTRDGASIVAAVSDTGCGIAPEDLSKLFQEFYRANDPVNQQVRGTGLGLALVKRIVEAHRGRIWVTSEKGQGSTFYVSLPSPPATSTSEG